MRWRSETASRLADGSARRTERTCSWSDARVDTARSARRRWQLSRRISRCAIRPHRKKTAPQCATAAEALGSTVYPRHAGRGLWHQLVIGGNGNGGMRRVSAPGSRSSASSISARMRSGFRRKCSRLPNDQIALLLRTCGRRMAASTFVDRGTRGSNRVYFSTCSQGLALDVAALLTAIWNRRAHAHAIQQRRIDPCTRSMSSGTEQQRLFISGSRRVRSAL